MGAPKGNQFWKQRSRHGRNVIFKTPEALFQVASEYFEWCDKHPLHRYEAVKGGDLAGTTVKVPISRPYTLAGMLIYMGTGEEYWRDFKKSKTAKKGFSGVIEQIEQIIYTQKFEGAAVGLFKENIIARDLGIADKKEHTGGNGGPIKVQNEIKHTLEVKRCNDDRDKSASDSKPGSDQK
jgi:hypothetical protein